MYIRQGTALAAANNEDNIRIYLQDRAGMVNEGSHDTSWHNGKKLFKAKIGSPLAVAHERLRQIRIYYLTDDNFLNEFVYAHDDGRWVLGSLGQKGFQVSPFTKLAARWDDGKPRVYAQLTDDTIQEFGFTNPNGTWDKLHNFGKGLYNTSIAITPYGSKRLYYQSTQGCIIEKLYENAWADGQFRLFASWGSPIVAIASDLQRVYHLSSSNRLVESVISEMGHPGSKCLVKEALDGSQLAVLEYDHNIRIYLQDEKEGTTISEYGYNHQTGHWVTAGSVLPS